MVPPGYHYFFFAKEEGHIFLSPKFEVARFKSTNVFMNRIYVRPRMEEMNFNVFQARQREEEEAVFMKDRSVFADFREDDDKYLKLCFEEDM